MPYYIEINSNGTPKTASPVYTTNEEALIPLLDITEDIEKKWPGSGREITQPRYFIKTTNSYIPISETVTTTRPTTGKYVDITRSYIKQTFIDSYLLDESALYAILISGHSNSTGMSYQARPASFVNESVNSNKKVEWNEAESAMIIADNVFSTPQDRLPQHIFQPTFYGNENPIVLVGNEMSKLIKEKTGKTIQFITVSGATNGSVVDNGATSQPELSNNSVHYQYFEDGIQAAKDYATGLGKTLKIPFMILINGEVEAIIYTSLGENEFRYISTLNQYRKNIHNTVTSVTGETYNFPIFRHQLHGQQMSETNNMNLKQYVLNSSFKDSPVILSSYQVSILSGFDHWDTTALFQIYGSFVNNIFRHLYQKNGVVFKPKKFTIAGNQITIDIDVPTPPLRIDTSRGLETYHGFVIKDSLSVEIPITTLEVNETSITLIAASSFTGGTLYYKLKRPYVPDLNRPASYIADSENFPFYGSVLSNYLLSFKQAL